MITQYNNRFALHLSDEKILYLNLKGLDEVSYQDFFGVMDQIRDLRNKYNSTFPCLITCDELTIPHKEVQDLLKSKFFRNYTLADAIVVEGSAQKLMATVFLRLCNFSTPAKVFDKPEEAINWLKQFSAS